MIRFCMIVVLPDPRHLAAEQLVHQEKLIHQPQLTAGVRGILRIGSYVVKAFAAHQAVAHHQVLSEPFRILIVEVLAAAAGNR
jgi:hypothetical protein